MTVAIWLLFLVPLGLALAAQGVLKSVFRRYRTVPNHAGATGAEVARALLDAHGLQDVRLELAPGFLSDHYDGQARALRLSEVVARERSVAANAAARCPCHDARREFPRAWKGVAPCWLLLFHGCRCGAGGRSCAGLRLVFVPSDRLAGTAGDARISERAGAESREGIP